MTGINHKAGGLTFTATFCSFFDVNILADWRYIVFTLFFSLLPDIDHNKSIIGKIFRPISGWLSTRYGHRTVTHSLAFYLSVVLFVAFTDRLFRPDFTYTLICAFALASHLIFDMCTVQGIPLFYPFSKRPCVLPGNPNLRLSSSNIKGEAVVFMFFCAGFFFNQPLFENGFWSQYNKVFLDYEHISREVAAAPDVLEVTYLQAGKNTESGYVVRVLPNEMILFSGGHFKHIPQNGTTFSDFRHTGRIAKEVQISAFAVSPDSLKKLLHQPVLSAQMQSNQELRHFENSILQTGKTLSYEYQTDYDFTVAPVDPEPVRAEIEKLQAQIAEKNAAYFAELQQLAELKSHLADIRSRYNSASDYEKGKLIEERKKLENEIVSFHSTKPPLLSEQAQMHELQRKLVQAETLLNASLTVWKF